MKIQKSLIDNSPEGYSMTEVLKTCISTDGIKNIRIATGYWDILGTELVYEQLNAFLKKDDVKVQLLIGKDPYIYSESIVSATEKYDRQEQAILLELNGLELVDPLNNVVKLLVEHIADKKLEIRIYNPDGELKDQFFHAKCYIFNGIFDGDEIAYGIIGSSNFTKKGLEGNSELNTIEDYSPAIIGQIQGRNKTHLQWFNDKWKHSDPWEKQFLKIVGQSKHKKILDEIEPKQEDQKLSLTPYQTYIKYLQMHYGNIVDANVKEQLISYLPGNFDALGYQLDAVIQCFQKLRDYKGFFLSDVVGLGKTIVGVLIIKKFIEEAETIHHRKPNVLIVTPPAIKKGWEDTIKKFDEGKPYPVSKHISFVTTGSIGGMLEDEPEIVDIADDAEYLEEDLTYNNYGLILIDESHNFRNSETQKYKALKQLIENIAIRDIQPYIGLLSATPQNNSPKDLRNQIYLFQLSPGESDFELGVKYGNKLDSYFVDMQDEFENCRNMSLESSKDRLKKLSEDIRGHILEHIVVRRTRSDIKSIYGEDAEKLKFPTVLPPHKLTYTMDDELVKLFSNTITTILAPQENEPIGTEHIGYYRYCAIMFFKDKKNTKLYEKRNLTVEKITARIAKIMRILLVKRLESSFRAFTQSLDNLLQYTQNMITMIEQDCVFICPDMDVNALFKKNNYNWARTQLAIREKIAKKKGNNREFRAADLRPDYLTRLKEDEKLLKKLSKLWHNNDLDPKRDAFHEAVKSDLFDKTINNPHGFDKQRLVIFTEAKDTQAEITRYMNHAGFNVLEISAENRDKLQNTIIENFDAKSEIQKDEYDVIVTTEVLAEGVNLHRSNVILNYDTPWNATRLMQRIGRVNRIGSKEEFIHVFNFFPTTQSNNQIHLLEKAYAKLQAFHTMFGEDSQIYSTEEEVTDANFNQIVDGEDSPDALFIKDLRNYQETHPNEYQQIVETDCINLGGQLPNSNAALFVMDAKYRNQSCFVVDNNEVKNTMPLSFMEHLRCEPDAQYDSLNLERYEQLKEAVMREYSLMLNRTKNAKDARKRMKDALKRVTELRSKLTTTAAKEALAGLDSAIRANNSAAIRLIEKFDTMTLFGPDEDINDLVTTLFNNMAAHATQKYGEPYVALYSI